MKHSLFASLLSISFASTAILQVFLVLWGFCACPFSSWADSGRPATQFPAVALLRSSSGSVCATGFWWAGNLVTAAHVIQELCLEDACSAVSLSEPSAKGMSERTVDFRVGGLFPALDVGVLVPLSTHADGAAQAIQVLKVRSGSASEEVAAIGFPNCDRMQRSRGRILETGVLHFDAGAQTTPGSSGSPVIALSDGALLGIVTASTSLRGALTGLIFGSSSDSRCAPAYLLQDLLDLSEHEALLEQARLLNSYNSELRAHTIWSVRFMASLDFLSKVEELRTRWLSPRGGADGASILAWSFLGLYPSAVPALSPSGASDGAREISPLEELVFRYNLELSGPHRSLFDTIDLDQLSEDLTRINLREDSKGMLHELVRNSVVRNEFGVSLTALYLGLGAALAIALAAALWGMAAVWLCYRLPRTGMFRTGLIRIAASAVLAAGCVIMLALVALFLV